MVVIQNLESIFRARFLKMRGSNVRSIEYIEYRVVEGFRVKKISNESYIDCKYNIVICVVDVKCVILHQLLIN